MGWLISDVLSLTHPFGLAVLWGVESSQFGWGLLWSTGQCLYGYCPPYTHHVAFPLLHSPSSFCDSFQILRTLNCAVELNNLILGSQSKGHIFWSLKLSLFSCHPSSITTPALTYVHSSIHWTIWETLPGISALYIAQCSCPQTFDDSPASSLFPERL